MQEDAYRDHVHSREARLNDKKTLVAHPLSFSILGKVADAYGSA